MFEREEYAIENWEYYEEDDEEELHWVDDDCEVQDEYVIAWKEIVLPKEIKQND